MQEESRKTNLPFFLKPAGKDYLWGGRRLNDDYAKNIDMTPLAETWECSTHPDGPSTVSSGEFEGRLLSDILKEHPEYIGTHPQTVGELPILIKLIDAKQDLSVQVHPDDTYAYEHENGQSGKDEMWYVLDAKKDSRLIYGLNRTVTKEELRAGIADGSITKYMQKVPVHKNDVFYIKAGTIHAIGAGVLLAEVQESSNLTYRLYDYDRTDRNGHKRELHVEKALAVANLNEAEKPVQPMRLLNYRRGWASEFLYRCKYFQTERILLNTERIREMVTVQTDSLSFMVMLCLEGSGMLRYENEILPFFKGDCIFIPADSVPVQLHGSAQFLRVSC
ncbi:MAG TPA: mannose-6-phosphate isomerase [Erysipelotrichaceae bacterium]|nr:mannose-6-phosphate isomerase [Erysipelotrichaceae bacterium]